MAKVTRIKAKDHTEKEAEKPASKKAAPVKQPSKKVKQKTPKKPMPKWLKIITWPFRMVAKPFIMLGRYIRDSWREIRQVRWPSRSATWKMVLAVFIYAGFFIILIMLLDAFFTWLFNLLLG
ncbi:preprotein translocase subunit SecE [Candidatus Saccharibacteria bacterium]|nr:preprotein translocase subunit SecE [Candidatus Saccharibacteria bacterium]